jgi:RimJ/RimL family protein N-acetyltransferase
LTVPTLESQRLRLRGWTVADVEPYAALCADADVMRYIGDGSVRSRDESAQQLDAFTRAWKDRGFGLWCVAPRETDACIGFVGLAIPDFLPEIMPAVEIGWRLARNAWHQGYATEAALAVRDYGFSTVGVDRLVSVAHADNVASHDVMHRIGMTIERRTRHPAHGFDVVVYELKAPSLIDR